MATNWDTRSQAAHDKQVHEDMKHGGGEDLSVLLQSSIRSPDFARVQDCSTSFVKPLSDRSPECCSRKGAE